MMEDFGMTKKKVIIGMSGGVDSSVAAAMLLEKGYEVAGLTMRLWDGEEINGVHTDGTCCSASAVEDARYVCYKLGIEHYVMDFRAEFERDVIDYFVNEYKSGRTPNPCIACNRHLKFDAMLKKAELLGAQYVATGHYAKIEYCSENGRYLLRRANASAKDQTYALFSLTQKQLAHTLMPLGELKDKSETREIAEKLGLITAKKPDSMEICFVPDKDYAGFIGRRTGSSEQEGNFVDTEGNVLGRHRGIIHYTVGQRKGLGVTFGKPMFVLKIDAERNEVVLGEKGEEFSKELVAEHMNFIAIEKLDRELEVKAKVRYSAREARARLVPEDGGRVRVVFEEAQRAVTPGQAVVFYDENADYVIGGGIIQSGK